MRFIYASIWRFVASGTVEGHNLGPYEAPILDAVLNNGPYDMQAMVGLNQLFLPGIGKSNVVISPHRSKAHGCTMKPASTSASMNAACTSQSDCPSSGRDGSHSGPDRRSTTRKVATRVLLSHEAERPCFGLASHP